MDPSLADTTVILEKAGHEVQYWPYHQCQDQNTSVLSMQSTFLSVWKLATLDWTDGSSPSHPTERAPMQSPCCKSSTPWHRESEFSSPSRSLENHRAKPVRADCAGELSYLWCFFIMARAKTGSLAGRRGECMWLWELKASRWDCYRWENWPSVSICSTGRGRGRGAGSCERLKWISIQFYEIASAGYARLLLHRVTSVIEFPTVWQGSKL